MISVQQEILNINYHTKRLLLKVLNSQPSKAAAARKVGLTAKVMEKKMKDLGITSRREGENIFYFNAQDELEKPKRQRERERDRRAAEILDWIRCNCYGI